MCVCQVPTLITMRTIIKPPIRDKLIGAAGDFRHSITKEGAGQVS